jgi:EAL domain-containing protein (putative c-di-GMP-specific phosphodiesterase class I)
MAMGQALGFQIVAEGAERIERIEFLKALNCTMYQGYFKSKPVRAEEFEKLLG